MNDNDESGDQFKRDFAQFAEAATKSLNSIDAAAAQASGDERIVGYVMALAEVMNIFGALPGFQRCQFALLSDLMLRLEDLSHGKKATMQELLDAVKVSGRSPHGFREEKRESRAVGAVEFLVEMGWDELDACGCIATSLTKAGVKGRRSNSVSPETVRGWLYKPRADRAMAHDTLATLQAMGKITRLDSQSTRRFMDRFFAAGEAS